MTDDRMAPYAALLLRVTLGAAFLAHSVVLKLMTYGLPGTAAFFETLGLPGALAYAVFFAEAVGGVMLILGVQSRWVSLGLLPVLLGALWTHAGFGWMFGSANGGWEYPAFWTMTLLVQALLGDGAHALAPSRPWPGIAGRPSLA